jgi:hypothetical protein
MMTAQIVKMALEKVAARLTSPTGLAAGLAALATIPATANPAPAFRLQNVAPDLVERTGGVRYPAVHIYCDKVVNELKEKFRRFSGRVQMVIEVRQSQDRLEGLEEATSSYLDATTATLGDSRGDWGDGMYYTGAYEVSIGAVKQGGRNFIQVA